MAWFLSSVVGFSLAVAVAAVSVSALVEMDGMIVTYLKMQELQEKGSEMLVLSRFELEFSWQLLLLMQTMTQLTMKLVCYPCFDTGRKSSERQLQVWPADARQDAIIPNAISPPATKSQTFRQIVDMIVRSKNQTQSFQTDNSSFGSNPV
jgi:hypothetical protein